MITDDDTLRSVARNQQEQSDEDDDNDEEVEEAALERLSKVQVRVGIRCCSKRCFVYCNEEEMRLVVNKFEKSFTED